MRPASVMRGVEWWRPDPGAAAIAVTLMPAPAPDAGSRLAFVGLGAFMFVLFIAPQVLLPELAPFRLAVLAAIVAIGATLATRSGRARALARPTRAGILVLCLLAWATATVPMSYWPGGSVSVLLDRFLKSVIVFWLIGQVVTTAPRLRVLLWWLSMLTVPLALTGIYHYRVGIVGADASARIAGYGSGLAANPNDLALMLALILPLTLVLATTATRRRVRIAGFAIAALSAAAVVATFSRGGCLTLAAVGGLYVSWLALRRRWFMAAALVVVALMSIPFLPSGYTARLATIVNFNSDPTGSSQDRWRDTLAATRLVAANPLIGAGIGMDILALNEVRGPTWRSVHNAYLNYGVDMGLPGMTLFTLLVLTCIAGAWRVERRASRMPQGGELSAMAAGIRMSLMAFAVAAFFYPVAYQYYFYYLAGLAVAVQTVSASVISHPVPASNPVEEAGAHDTHHYALA